jgi:hypothetical protein
MTLPAAGRQIIQVPPGGGTRGRLVRTGGLALAIFIVLVLLFKLFHHENRYESLAADVTRAIAANDMAPVADDFNAQYRPQLADRAKVGALSDFVNELGAFKDVKEDTPAGSAPDYHHFVADFAQGQRSEDLKVDSDGKITSFHVRSITATPGSP